MYNSQQFEEKNWQEFLSIRQKSLHDYNLLITNDNSVTHSFSSFVSVYNLKLKSLGPIIDGQYQTMMKTFTIGTS